jgi:hypothetical protein
MRPTKYIIACALFAAPAFAQDANTEGADEEMRPAEMCFPAKDMIKYQQKFAKLDAKKKDTVSVKPAAQFEIMTVGASFPQRFFVRDGDVETDMPILPDGSVPSFGTLFAASKDAEICIFDPARAGTPKDEKSIKFDVNMDVSFNQAGGTHSLAELEDGLKDGKSHYKKMFGAMSFMMPNLTHVILSYEAEDTPVQITATQGGAPITGLTSEAFAGAHVIEVAAIEALGGDGLQIVGGTYQLEPGLSVEKMKKFGFGEDDDESEDASE